MSKIYEIYFDLPSQNYHLISASHHRILNSLLELHPVLHSKSISHKRTSFRCQWVGLERRLIRFTQIVMVAIHAHKCTQQCIFQQVLLHRPLHTHTNHLLRDQTQKFRISKYLKPNKHEPSEKRTLKKGTYIKWSEKVSGE